MKPPLATLRTLGLGPEAPTGAKQRVYGALLGTLHSAAAAKGAEAAPGPAPQADLATAAAAGAPMLASVTGSKAVTLGLGIWLFGAATGVALYGATRDERVRVVYVDRPVLMGAPAIEAVKPAAAAGALNSSAAPFPSATLSENTRENGPPVGTQSAHASRLARERALLDLARTDAAHGEPASVLKRVEQHRAQFPRGQLAEEREALAIRALLSLGRANEARARAAQFHAAYPNSFLGPVIDAALTTP